MGINLVKGQKIDLTKGSTNLSEVMVGLGWDPVEKKGGFLSSLFGASNIDCDASVLLLNGNDKLKNQKDVVYFRNLKNSNQSIVHMGDNLTGDGAGDDEQIMLHLNKIPSDVKKIVFVVNIYDCKNRNQDFGMIKNAYIRILDKNTNSEMCKFNLTEDYAGKTSIIVGEVYRNDTEWKFNAVGQGTNDTSLSQIVQKYK